MVRKAIIDATTQENVEATLTEVLKAVAAGNLDPRAAKGGLIYLINSIDIGAEDEIKTWSNRGKLPYMQSVYQHSAQTTSVSTVDQWNAAHPIGSRFLCEQYPDVVLTSQAPAFFVEGRGTAVECKIPGHAVGGGILVDDLVCVDGLKSRSARIRD